MRNRLWYGVEEFGADIIFNIGDSASKLNTLKESLIGINKQMELFTTFAANFNKAVNNVVNITSLVKALEELIAAQIELGPPTDEGNKKAVEADAIRKRLIKTTLQQNQVYNAENKLVKEQTVGLDALNRKITVNANAKGKLLGVNIKDTVQTQAQINAQKKLAAQYERAKVQFAALSDLRKRGLFRELSIVPKYNSANNQLVETWKGLDKEGKAFTATVTRVGNQLVSVRGTLPTLDRSMQATKKTVTEFTLSWKTMLRIIAAQAIRRVLFTFVAQLKESITTAIDFSVKIAEVRTISQQNQLATAKWAEGLRELSDSFGIDLLNQTEAAYQTLSNQVAHGAEVFGFLEQANKLAIATVSDSATAVQLLTAVQNAYNLTNEDTGKIAAKTFKIIELGRLRLNEISNSIGQIAAPAHLLGISFDELGAALDVITKRGIPVNEAQTLLRGIFISLIRPTKEMTGLLKEIGFNSSEAAIKVLGLGGVFGELEKRTKGSLTEIGKFTRRIRGTVGEAVFAGKGLQEYTKTLEGIQNSEKTFNNTHKIIFENAGKIVQVEMNKIKNYFTQDFAAGFIDKLAYINTKIISLTTVVKTLADAFKVILAPAIFLSGAALTSWLIELDPVVATVTAIALAVTLFKNSIDATTNSIEKQSKEIEKSYDKQVKAAKEANRKLVDSTYKSYKEMENIVSRSIANIRGKNSSIEDSQLAIDKILGKSIKAAYSNVAKSLKAGLKDIKDSLKEARSIVTDSANKIVSLRRELEQKLFESVLGKIEDPAKQIIAIQNRIKALKLSTINVGVDKKAIADAENAYKEIGTLYDLLNQKQKEVTTNAKKEISVREQIKKINEEIAKVKRKANVDELKAIAKIRRASTQGGAVHIITGGDKTTVDTTNQRAIAANADRLRKQADSEAKINKLVTDRNKLLNTLTTLEKSNLSSSKNFIDIEAKKLQLLQDQIKFREELRVKAAREAELEEARLQKRKKTITTINDAYVKIVDLTAKGLTTGNDLTKQKADIKTALSDIDNFQKILTANRNIIDSSDRVRLEEEIAKRRIQLNKVFNIKDREQKLRVLEEETKQRLAIIAEEKKASETQIQNTKNRIIGLRQAILEMVKSITGPISGPNSNNKNAVNDQAEKVLKNITAVGISELRKMLLPFTRVKVGPANIPSIRLLEQSIIDLYKLQRQDAANKAKLFKSQEENAKKLKELKDLQRKIDPNAVLKDQLGEQRKHTKTLSQILEAIQKLVPSTPTTKANGGQIGTDSIPAMLSPGEFVMNAKSTKRFHSQLVAMNASQGFARGGMVNNVGDVNVSMQSSGNENYDVTKFGKLLRRQIRRGTLKLN